MSNRELSFSLGIGTTPQSEIEDPDLSAEMFRLYNAINTIASQLDAVSGSLVAAAADRPYILPSVASKELNITRGYGYATVAFALGELAHLNSSGQLVKALSDTSHSLKAQVVITQATVLGGYAPYSFAGVIKAYVGLAAGSYYYLSETAGAISSLLPATGKTVQIVGFAVSPSELYFKPSMTHTVA